MIERILNFYLKKVHPLRYAKRIGVSMGGDGRLIGSPIWGSEPWLITIGKRVEIANEVRFITHDGATWVIRNQEKYKNVVRFGRITIGDNCFIGARATIMPDVTIGNNCIVAAGAVVTKLIPDGEIWGGVPAKFISKVDVWAEKCLDETPEYDLNNYKTNFKDEVLKIVEEREHRRDFVE